MTLFDKYAKLTKTKKYLLFGLVGCTVIFTLFVLLMLLLLLGGSCSDGGCFLFLGLLMLPGILISDSISPNLKNIPFPIDASISIFFYFIIGFILGMLVYKMYLIKHEKQ